MQSLEAKVVQKLAITVEAVFNHDSCPVREQVWYELADSILFIMIGGQLAHS